MFIRAFSFWHGGGGGAAPDVEFLDAVQVAETDGTNNVTAMSGSFTPHVNAGFIIGVMMGRNGATGINGSAMTQNGVSMGTALSTDDGLSGINVTIHAFGASSFAAGTLSYTRSAGTYVNAQLWGISCRYVASVGTPVKAAGTASPAQAAITPVAIGDLLLVISITENVPTADGELTPVNCTERLDLVCPDATAAERTIAGLGTLPVDQTASPETLGFSFAGTSDRWSCHVIPLLKA